MTKNTMRLTYSSFVIRHLSSALLLCFMTTQPALATPEQEFEQTQKDIKATKERQAALAEEAQKLKEELKPLQDRLVKAAEATQKTEHELTETEEKLHGLNDELKTKGDTLKVRQQRLSSLIIAELSLSSTPPEAMIMMPQDPMDIMKAARALNMASDGIRQEARALSRQLAELNKLKDEAAKRRDELASLEATLAKQKSELESEVEGRTALQKKLGLRQKQEEETLAKLARKASDLRDLISGIEKEATREEEQAAKPEAPAAPSERRALRSFAGAQGHIRSPVAGSLVQKFGTSQGKNATSKGITIATRAHAQVTAPYDGEVVFVGPFLNYGQIVILRHSDDFHTLLAGFSKIDVEVGQFLLEGEPIGAMGDSDADSKGERSLYIEIRKDNQPVDPTQWIGGLNKSK